MVQNNSNQTEIELKEYYDEIFENNSKILATNEKTLNRIKERDIQKKIKDHKNFKIVLEVFLNSNRKTKDYSDFIVGFTEDTLLNGAVKLTDKELQFLLCILDVYSTTSSCSNTMESHVSTLKRSANLFGSRDKGDVRVSIANKVIKSMLDVINHIKNTIKPIGAFAQRVLKNFEERIDLFKDSIIALFYGNMYKLEKCISSTKVLNDQIRLIEPENFDEKFNEAFDKYLKMNISSC